MNRIAQLFKSKKQNIFSVYFTAGFPKLNDTVTIITELADQGADLIEIGMPFSDPLADGKTIQQSSQVALQNGMSLNVLFDQLAGIRQKVDIPLILMGYLNPVLQFDIEKFCKKCQETGIDGLILPDLPVPEYETVYRPVFEQYGLYNIFLITPQTSPERIRKIDNAAKGFLYMVSSASTTGAKQGITDQQKAYFERINSMNLKNPRLIGFGISDRESFSQACKQAQGAIIGSAFIKALQRKGDLKENIRNFARKIL